MKTKILAAMAVFAGICAMAPTASADPPKKSQDYEYKFGDETLLGSIRRGQFTVARSRIAQGRSASAKMPYTGVVTPRSTRTSTRRES